MTNITYFWCTCLIDIVTSGTSILVFIIYTKKYLLLLFWDNWYEAFSKNIL